MKSNIKAKQPEEMKVKEGYKRVKLEHLCVIKGEYGINAAAADYNPNLPAYLRITDIDDNNQLDLSKRKSVNDDNSENFILGHNDIVFARTGATVGKTYLHDENKNGIYVFAGFLIRFKADENLLNPQYLKLYTETLEYWNWVRVMSVRSGQPGINGKEYCSLKIPLPPLPEQKKIADILSTWDKAIETTQVLIKKLQLRKKGLMQQLLTGKKRLPGFGGEWEVVQFSDVANRLTKKNEELHDNVVTISAQRGFVRQEDFFKKRVASKTLSGYYLVDKGDFCYNKSYSKGYPMGAFKRLDDFEKAVVTTLYICFRLTEKVNSDFMVNYFEGGMIVNNLMKIAQEGGRAHGLLNISLGDFFGLKMTIPKKEEQTAIAEVLTKADDEIHQTQYYLEQLQEQKKGLMQQLLTGQKRVKV